MAIELISKIKPKNGSSFPLVDAVDVAMEDGTRLSDAIRKVQGSGYVVSTEPPENINMLWLDPLDGGTDDTNDNHIVLDEIDDLLGGDE